MTLFEDLKATMDAGVDSRLGDSISYDAGLGPIPECVGFIIPSGDALGADGRNTASIRYSLKLRKSWLDGPPMRSHRITSAKLDDIYQPGPAVTHPEDPEYWLMDLQKVTRGG